MNFYSKLVLMYGFLSLIACGAALAGHAVLQGPDIEPRIIFLANTILFGGTVIAIVSLAIVGFALKECIDCGITE